MFNALPPRPIPVPGQEENPGIAQIIQQYLAQHGSGLGGIKPPPVSFPGYPPANVPPPRIPGKPTSGGFVQPMHPGGDIMQLIGRGGTPLPMIAPRNPAPSQPNLAQLRNAITQLHAQQMVQRMQAHSQYHNNKIGSA